MLVKQELQSTKAEILVWLRPGMAIGTITLDYCLLDLLGGRRRFTQQLIPSSLCRSSPISGTSRE